MIRSAWFAAIGAVLLAASQPACGQGGGSPNDGITVGGTGQTMVKPNKLEIEVRASAAAELSADALLKYRDAIRRSKETFAKLKISGLQVVEQGLNVANNNISNQNVSYAAPGQLAVQAANAPGIKQEMTISKSLRLVVTGIDSITEDELVSMVAKLLDGIRDAGLTTGPDPNNPNAQAEGQLANAVVMFVADNLEQARKQATAAAFQNAKEKAQRIAELAEGKLGAAAAVEESPSLNAMNDEAAALGMLTAIYAGGSVGAENPSLKSAILVELPVRVNLRVRFNLQSRGGEK